ncbi:hypothetical protein BD289DRAFT_127917 [Coniella lustricola]|uniref:F-box domain-containing protein n=1 Tax=Coniella lustricola TaxID=2025994 RepID=A0A2T2ZW83_9PEZI|nr:hypothetical protein BD289DRAFT_127917 [Coniella lustricola]
MAVSHDYKNGGHVPYDDAETTNILSLLLNPLLLSCIVDYLPISATLNLSAVSHSFRGIVYQTPLLLRHLDLSPVKAAQFDIAPIDQGGNSWRNVQLDENVTEDDFYAGPLRGIFSSLRRRNLLRDVSTLVLDGLSVTAELIHDIISDSAFPVRILSLREVKNLNEPKLRAVLQMAVRPSRPAGTPRLRGLYLFGPKDPPSLPANPKASLQSSWNQRSHQALAEALNETTQDCSWYERKKGGTKPRPISHEWASTMLACAGIISFDAVLCRGPCHLNSPAYGKMDLSGNISARTQASGGPSNWAVTTMAVNGCAGCGSAPEGWTVWGDGHEGVDADDDTCRFPLLSPPPVHSSNVRAAKRPSGVGARSQCRTQNGAKQPKRFIARCIDCLQDRYCWSCSKWWCESCYTLGQMDSVEGLYNKFRMSRSCWECDVNCASCIEKTQRVCNSCRGGYCTIHHDGCTQDRCDWCAKRRLTRELY